MLFLTDTTKCGNNKHDISSNLGTVNFLLGTIFDLAVTKFVVIILFLHDHALTMSMLQLSQNPCNSKSMTP